MRVEILFTGNKHKLCGNILFSFYFTLSFINFCRPTEKLFKLYTTKRGKEGEKLAKFRKSFTFSKIKLNINISKMLKN